MDQENVVHLEAGHESADEGPALISDLTVGFVFELTARPVAGSFSAGVEIGGFVEDGVVMIAHDSGDFFLDDQIEAGAGFGAVADDVAQAKDFVDTSGVDVGQDGPQRDQVGVQIGDDGKSSHKKSPCSMRQVRHPGCVAAEQLSGWSRAPRTAGNWAHQWW